MGNGDNGQGTNRALALPDIQTALESSEEAQSMRNQAAIWRAVLPNGSSLSDTELLAGVAYGKSQGLDPVRGDFYIVHGIGVVPGYRGEIKKQSGRKYSEPIVQPRQATAAEVDQNDIQPGDILAVCDLYDPDAAHKCRELGIKYVPITGIGIMRKGETRVPVGKSRYWVARNRAEKDARRHWGGAVDADEVLAEYGEVEPVPDGVVLTTEQARAWGETHSVAAIEARKTVTPEQMAAFEQRQREQAAELGAFENIDVAPTPADRPMPGLTPSARQLTASEADYAETVETAASPAAKSTGHWIDDEKTRRRFWTWTRNDLNLVTDDVYRALGVDHIHEFTGTPAEARDTLRGYADAKAAMADAAQAVLIPDGAIADAHYGAGKC